MTDFVTEQGKCLLFTSNLHSRQYTFFFFYKNVVLPAQAEQSYDISVLECVGVSIYKCPVFIARAGFFVLLACFAV